MTTGPKWYLGVINVLRFSALDQNCTSTMKWTTAGLNLQRCKERSILAQDVIENFLVKVCWLAIPGITRKMFMVVMNAYGILILLQV